MVESKPATPTTMTTEWACPACDFCNLAALTRCDLCDTARPKEAPPLPPSSPALPPAPRAALGTLAENPGALEAAVASGGKKSAVTELPPLPPSPPPAPPQQPQQPPANFPAPPAAAEPPAAANGAGDRAPTPAGAASASSSVPPDPSDAFAGESFAWSAEAAKANELVFGDGPLRPLQLRAVNAAMSGKDVLVVMPTGAGKSRCFHLPALLAPGLTVVVAPLVSLILDQVEALARQRVRVLYLASTQTAAEAQQVYSEINRSPPTCKLLYVTPERLQQSMHLRAALSRLHTAGLLARLVVDEAHCVVSWGKDFRPDYLSIGPWLAEMPGLRTTLLSATLPPPMREELLDVLNLRSEIAIVKSGLDRPNLSYEVWPKLAPRAAADQLAEMLLAAPADAGCAIVYCHSQAETERVCDALQERGLLAAYYHAMVDPEVKQLVHAQARCDRPSAVLPRRPSAFLPPSSRPILPSSRPLTPSHALLTTPSLMHTHSGSTARCR